MFLSCQLFGMGLPALELAGHWVELGLSNEMEISGRALANSYYVGLGGVWWSMSLSQPSLLRGSGLTPNWNTKTLSATQLL